MTRIDGNVLVNASHLYNIADAIRSKSGDDSLLIPADMAGAIMEITGGEGGSGGDSFKELAVIIDNPSNGSKSYTVDTYEIPASGAGSGTLSYIFVYSDNQRTNMQIGDNQHLSSEMFTWPAANDSVYTFADSTDFTGGAISETLNGGDWGNHACTLVGYLEKTIRFSQALREALSVSVTADASLDAAYVVFLFCVYGGPETVTVELMGESIVVPRYASRYSNSIYLLIRQVSGITSGDAITAQITSSVDANNVIGMLGVFA